MLPSLISHVELDLQVLSDLDELVLASVLDPDLHLVVSNLWIHSCNNCSKDRLEIPGI
jgi:hypothetical protein